MMQVDGFGSSGPVGALLLGALAVALMPVRPRLRPPQARPASRRAPPSAGRRAAVWALAVGGATAVLLPDRWWIALVVAAATGGALRLRPAGRSPARRARDRRLAAVCAELLSACLDAGMAVGPALRAVCETVRGTVDPADADDDGPAAMLDVVAVMLTLGADADTAWRIADLDEDLAPLAAAARRSASGGGRLADAAREHAAQLREDDAAAAVHAAGRAGVLMTAPLGVCFLPAFLCLGLAPVVLGLLGQLSIF